MKVKIKRLLIIILILLLANILASSFCYGNTTTDMIIDTNSQNLSLYSESAILIDSNTGMVLYGKNENQKMFPASTTKILTAIIALEKCNLTDQLTASRNAVMCIPVGYSNAGIQENESFSLEDLLNAFLLHSANEIGYIIAEHISGNAINFAELMNEKALEIGCKNTHFTNPSGIHDDNHYSTAYDMALITRYCMQNDIFRSIVSKSSCKLPATEKCEERYFVNTNDLLRNSSKYYYEYAIGVKTGYTKQAKNCLISASLKDNLELITVVLGAQSTEKGESARYVDTINLFNYGFDNYKSQEIVQRNSVITNISIPNGTTDSKDLPVLIKDSIFTTLPLNYDLNSLNYSIELDENLSAPISENSVIGKITYNFNDINYSSDLIASHSVEKSDLILVVCQILLVILILCFLAIFISPKTFYTINK